jgi:LmbE family N-acetylglucosaminyl deacetylase
MTILAVSAHPDDIEFTMAGTLLLLKKARCDIHLINIANGCYGSMTLPPQGIAAVRWQEALASARLLGAELHEPLVDDLDIFYTPELVRRLTAVVRAVKPDIVLTLSLEDYMEDHMNAARLAVTATFLRGVPSYRSLPDVKPVLEDAMVYHGTPISLTDMMRRPIVPEIYVDVTSVIGEKEKMLACHASQKGWLDATQGFDSYLLTMRDMAEKVGALSGKGFRCAEGWRRHSHAGYTLRDGNPLADLLSEVSVTTGQAGG